MNYLKAVKKKKSNLPCLGTFVVTTSKEQPVIIWIKPFANEQFSL